MIACLNSSLDDGIIQYHEVTSYIFTLACIFTLNLTHVLSRTRIYGNIGLMPTASGGRCSSSGPLWQASRAWEVCLRAHLYMVVITWQIWSPWSRRQALEWQRTKGLESAIYFDRNQQPIRNPQNSHLGNPIKKAHKSSLKITHVGPATPPARSLGRAKMSAN